MKTRSTQWTWLVMWVLAIGQIPWGLVADEGDIDDGGATSALYRQAALIHFTGPINSRLEQYIYRKLNEARELSADLVIFEIDSPGGELEASLRLARHFRDLGWADTVAYVPEQALSGAAIAALGCNEIVLHSQAVFGDAGPIVMDYMEFGFRHAPEKIQTDLARRVRDLASTRERSPALAEAMVDKDLIVYRVRHRGDGRERFMSDEEIQADTAPDQWAKINEVLESRANKFLEVSGERAKELGLADGVIGDENELQKRYGLANPPRVLQRQLVDSVVDVFHSWWGTVLLIVIALLALYIELSAPGISIGGLTTMLCFALFFWSRFWGGTADWLEVILFLSGIVFILVELFLIPGFGVAGISGCLLVLVSLIMAGHSFLVPETASEMKTLTRTIMVLFGSGLLAAIGAITSTWCLGEIPLIGRLALQPSDEKNPPWSEEQPLHQSAHHSSMQQKQLTVGDIGVADSPLRPAGVARFGDDFYDVVSEGTFIEELRRVKVIRISGNHIVVRDVDHIV